jgi:hypothetical protein
VTASRRAFGGIILAVSLTSLPGVAAAQFDGGKAIGQFYTLEPPLTTYQTFLGVRVERVAPGYLAAPPPIDPIAVRVPMRLLTGQILELPERGRIYFTAIDAAGALRLIELDLVRRESRTIDPPFGSLVPTWLQMLVPPQSTKIYVQWYGPGFLAETHIYDSESLRSLGRTNQFLPDERAAGFVGRDWYAWTLDPIGRPLLLDTQRDQVAAAFDHRRWFDQVNAVVADAWGDVLLYRIDVGHDRYQLVDVRSGEIGPPLDLEGYGLVQPRLVLDGRMLVLIDIERRPLRRATRFAETAVALGGGAVYSLRDGSHAADFHLVVPFDLPATSIGTTDDPAIPGRLWVHGPRDDQRFDFDLPSCRRPADGGDRVQASLHARWSPDAPQVYSYAAQVSETDDAAVGALAVEVDGHVDRSAAPEGWGMDLLDQGDWLRWSNALGPIEENIAPGSIKQGFVISADEGTRPGIVEYRIQAALGLPRRCESDGRFLQNSHAGWTIGPDKLETIDPKARAERLERLVTQACEIGWVGAGSCPELTRIAGAIVDSRSQRPSNLDSFLQALTTARTSREATAVLSDAAAAVREIVDPLP